MRKEQVIDMDAHRKSLVFTELVNINELRELCESFTAITGAVTAILDLEGNILIATGWQDICTRFHRVHITTASRCRESDITLAGQLKKGEGYSVCKCKNGLVDVAVPITIDGEHTANLFTGQFFFEPPDKNHFIRQAEEFGFDKTDYLAALSRVPIFSENQVRTMMDFLSRLARLIGEMGLVRKSLEVRVEQRTANLRNTNEQLQREIAERKQAEEQLKFTNVLLSTTQETSIDGILVVDENARILSVNRRFVEMWGIPAKLVEEKVDEPVLQFTMAQLVDPKSNI
ncbi:MAG: PocR ligand-binding domain-containing protein, partial [Desulfobulbus sp.]|nr:PocR ligand-binding domain-containing protein [Desulfobulbus sp.]